MDRYDEERKELAVSQGPEDGVPSPETELDPATARHIFEALAAREGNGLPTTLDYRLKALEVVTILGHHEHGMAIKSADQLVKEAKIVEAYLRAD